MNNLPRRQRNWKLKIFALLLLGGLSGCSTWKWSKPLSSLDPAAHREREITRQAKADPFPTANQMLMK